MLEADLTLIPIYSGALFNKLVSASSEHEHSVELYIHAGDTINLYTSDLSASGTVAYSLKMLIQEYDL
ncbi:MAG: hypothetical protein H8D23_25305 [Candidatus Brocadiales bacterium]|nr:hypothetical protein [Candidatus Brocadiales bacterium]